jgi:acyl-[acyl-carrier-protein]-phospholipid O-acyltransferase/long-chain-fatty-acid--[acyl-carrier-protein] ligase
MDMMQDTNRTPPAGLPPVCDDPVGRPEGRGFQPLLALRALTVVNDNALRWLAIGLGKKAVSGGQVALVLTIGTAGFVLPFVLLAWLAGWLADRYPKRSVIVWCKAAEIAIVAAAAAAIAWGVRSGGMFVGLPAGLWLLLATVVVIGCQAALLAPAVIGTIPETVPATRLSHANGIFALVTLAATLVGMAAGNWLADGTVVIDAAGLGSDGRLHSAPAWLHAMPAGIVLVGLALAGWVAAVLLVRRPAADAQAPPPWNALSRTWRDLAELFSHRELAAAAAGIVFFWALGAVAQLNVDQYATESGATSQGQIVPLLIVLVSGIGLGSLVAGRVSTRGVDMGLVPLGAVLMAVASLGLALGPRDIFGAAATAWWWAAAGLGLLGFGAGMFDVPLEATFQEKSPPARRGALLAAANLLTFAGMFGASMLYGALRSPSPWAPAGAAAALPLLSARAIFGLFGLLAAGAAGLAIYAAPRASLRIFVSSIVHATHRFRVVDADRLPATGPAVVVSNHLSWLDGFVVVLSCLRPIRMVVYGPNIRGRFLRMLSDQWRFILFDPKPKSMGQALKAIQSGLAAGDVIGIFSEGGISRTGQILGFKRGLEWILERVEAPIVPLHIDGMWGSPLSFSEGRYFTKWPRKWRRPLTLSYGPPLPVGTHTREARLALQELSAQAVRRRMNATWAGRSPGADGFDWAAVAAEAEAFDGCCLVRRGDRLLVSLGAGDPLFGSLGRHAGRLLCIRAHAVDTATPPAELAASIRREGITIWLARVSQVQALAEAGGSLDAGFAGTLAAVVMPIATVAELPRAEAAAAAFAAAYGVEPVVAFAPAEAGGLVAMNSPPARVSAAHEVTRKAGSVGRVVHGVVVWPTAAARARLDRDSLEVAAGAPDRSLVIGATLPAAPGGGPRAALLETAFAVDEDGFLQVAEPNAANQLPDSPPDSA